MAPTPRPTAPPVIAAAPASAPVVVEKQPEVLPIAATTAPTPEPAPLAEAAASDSPVAVTTKTTTTADGVKHIELSLSAKEKTWLSISSGGKQIFSGVLEAEETKTLSGLEMAKMTVGNAGGIDVHLNGKDVGPLVHAGQIDQVRAYCLCDVVQTAGVFQRVQLLRGELTPLAYQEAMAGLIAAARAEPRVAPVVSAWNEARLRLSEPAPESA